MIDGRQRAASRPAIVLLLALLALGAACRHIGIQGAGDFRVTANVPEASVYVDGIFVGRVSQWDRPGRRLRPGFHRVEIRHPDHFSHFAEVELRDGGSALVEATLRPRVE